MSEEPSRLDAFEVTTEAGAVVLSLATVTWRVAFALDPMQADAIAAGLWVGAGDVAGARSPELLH